MIKKIVKGISISLSLGLLLSGYAFAATDGTLGATSTGTSDISLTVPELILISGMADVSFGTWSGSGDLDGNEDVCIYTNKAAGTYVVTATGDGAANAFTVTDGSNTIAYAVAYNDVSGTTGEAALTTNVQSAQQSGADTSSQSCGGSDNANFHVTVTEANLLAAPAGAYSGTLTLVVEPN